MSELKMIVNYLRKDELTYELILRGITVEIPESTDQLRTYLRPLIKLEKLNKSVTYPVYPFNAEDELKVCSTKFDELKSAFTSPQSNLLSITTRVCHLVHRFERIPVDQLQPVSHDSHSALAPLLTTLATDVSNSNSDSDSILLLSQLNVDDSDSDHSEMVGAAVSHGTTLPKTFFEPIRKWNLKFSGESKGMTVHNFLERVDELRLARNVNNEQLFASAIDLFEGKALLWFRSNHSRLTSWKELATLLRKHYEPPDYRARLLNDIMSRSQDVAESIVEYLACMTALFRRYGPVSEELQLGIIVRNLSPFYSTQLPIVQSLEELEDVCLKLETKKYRAEHYVPPSRKRTNYVEPDLACFSGSPSVSCSKVPVNEVVTPAVGSKLTCWNCRGSGHLMRDCRLPKKLLCYRCGKHDYTIKTCPQCSVSGNPRRRN